MMMMMKLRSGTSKTKVGRIVLKVSLCNLLTSMCDFVPHVTGSCKGPIRVMNLCRSRPGNPVVSFC